jgi:hypothetical protein
MAFWTQKRTAKALAASLVRARQRLAERMQRIGPVLWDIKHIEFLRQTRAAIEIQRVYRGHVGRFRVEVVRMQLKLVMLPKVRRVPSCRIQSLLPFSLSSWHDSVLVFDVGRNWRR